MIYTINGITAQTEEIRIDDELRGYYVIVNGERVGNRIARVTEHTADPRFYSLARNELVIAQRDTLHEAVADVVNEGMRDKARG